MEPVTLTADRLVLRPFGPHDADAVHAAVQDPDIQRWTTIPSPYLPEHAAAFTAHTAPEGWADGSMFTFGVFLRDTETAGTAPENGSEPDDVRAGSEPVDARSGSEPVGARAGGGTRASHATTAPAEDAARARNATDTALVGALSLTMRSLGTAEIGFWTAKEHRGRGYTTEATLTAVRWAFTRLAVDRVEWRAEVGNTASRTVAAHAGFTLEGTLRSAINNKGVRRDCWIGSLLPSDLGLPSTAPYLPATA
ncbi:GNAT family N-acetyltransferase [Streptomyces sp. NPDC091281]|uniref:GNAT family N-acetyltransferase n=1 Tax=Streptomyces sp. NPDC091281 TaxID=3365985 RepID=UPI003811CE8C